MKYTLIKCYPGSPELGTVVTKMMCGGYDKYQGYVLPENINDAAPWGLNCYEVEEFPEYWIPETETISFHTNSRKGSLHWLNTLLGRHLRIGEALNDKMEIQLQWGEFLMDSSKEIMEYFKDKLK